MTASPRNKTTSPRASLGSPIIPINSPGAYLRHRMAAEKAYAARRRLLWWHRALIALIICVFYLAIGRDLIALASAKKDTAKMEIEHDAQQLRQDLKRITGTVEQVGKAPVISPESASTTTQLEALAQQSLETGLPAK